MSFNLFSQKKIIIYMYIYLITIQYKYMSIKCYIILNIINVLLIL